MSLRKFEIAYSSDFFLDNKKLRASLALMFDKIYLLSLADPEVKHVDMMTKEQDRSDGVLGTHGVIERKISRSIYLTKPAELGISEDKQWFLPSWMRWMSSSPDIKVVADRMLDKLDRALDQRHLLSPAIMPQMRIEVVLKYILSYWEETLIPRFFDEDEGFFKPIAVEDTALLVHQGVSGLLFPDVGELEDDELLDLREKTESERLGYIAYILEIVDELEAARHTSDFSELKRIINDKIKTKIAPAFIEYSRSLEILKQIKRTRFLDRVIQAIRVEGSIFEPKFWVAGFASLLSLNEELSEDQLKERTNKKAFLSFITRINEWSEKMPVIR